jgi:hypothetical protein
MPKPRTALSSGEIKSLMQLLIFLVAFGSVMKPQVADASTYNLGFVYLFKAADMIRHPLRALFVVSVFVYYETVLEGQYIDAQLILSFAIFMVGGAAILAVGLCSGQSAIERFPMYVLNFLKEASENSTNHIHTFKT